MSLLELIRQSRPLLLDGAMGTELARRGCIEGGASNVHSSETVLAIHQDYAKCGCRALITNTLTMNRIFIETHGVGVDVEEVNRAGVQLARRAADDGQFVLGDMSSTGQMLEPYGEFKEEDFHTAFLEQARVLAGEGVDALLVETMFDLREALCALRACKEVASLPVFVSMAFSTQRNGGRTMMGNSAEKCARELTNAGADAVGANCGEIGPEEMAEIILRMRAVTDLPIIAQPNAGKPSLEQGVTRFNLEPAPFAEGIMKCVYAGATLVGGCCGTSPGHIQAVATRLAEESNANEPR